MHIGDQLDFSLLHGFRACLRHSKFLSKHLHLFQDIPLRVSSVQPLDPPTFSLLEILVHALLSLFKRFVICYYYYYYYYYFLGKRDLLFD